jgi:hypothetical protein
MRMRVSDRALAWTAVAGALATGLFLLRKSHR